MMLNNTPEPPTAMQLIHMTPEQVANRLIAERLVLGNNAKEMQQQVMEKKALARRKIEDIEIGLYCEKA